MMRKQRVVSALMTDTNAMFTPPEPTVARTQVMVRMPDELRNNIIDIAIEQGLSMNETIVQMLTYCQNILIKNRTAGRRTKP